jgi:membrane-bound lytic murein transglycosylase D
MRSLHLILLFVLCTLNLRAQEADIPEFVSFAGMELSFTHSARKILKTEVENLKRNPKYFQMKVERADVYFPVIEKVFKSEGFPDEFKYLALQESSLVPDAVSSSNAVGYWQFKKESAQEVGLRVDNEVDERMNIVAASRGAAKYLSRNNGTLKNWIYALLSYNLGLGGVKKEVDSKYLGATHMKIDDNMHWYVMRFLAHKFAFENEVGKVMPKMALYEFGNCRNMSLEEIAKETGLSEADLVAYNKWVLKKDIPGDKDYVVVLPVKDNEQRIIAYLAQNNTSVPVTTAVAEPKEKRNIFRRAVSKPESSKNQTAGNSRYKTLLFTSNNRLKVIKAKEGDTFDKMVAESGLKYEDFLLYNEIKKTDKVIPGTYYYIQSKRNKALADEEYVVKAGETIWMISQQFGVRSSALRKKNKMKLKEEPKEGRVLLLRKKLKKGESPRYENQPAQHEKAGKPEGTASHTESLHPKGETAKPKAVEPAPSKQEYISLEDDAPAAPVNTAQPESMPEVNHLAAAEDTSAFVYHFVQPGETMYSLSKKYNVKADSLAIWNDLGNQGLKASSNIIVGKKNKPEKSTISTEENFIWHTVQPGETLYRISKLYGKPVEDILNWNNKTDFSVAVGEKLKIIQP